MKATTLFSAGYGGLIYSLSFSGNSTLSITSKIRGGVGPSWLEQHPSLPLLYSVDEMRPNDGSVSVWNIGKHAKLSLRGSSTTGGEGPVHLAFHNAESLYVANYAGGTVARLAIAKNGSFVNPKKVQQRFGFNRPSTNEDDDSVSHPHGVFVDPTGSFLITPDLGLDVLRPFTINARTSSLSQLAPVSRPTGSGSRHLRFHKCPSSGKTFLYLVDELKNNLAVFSVTYPSSSRPHHSTTGMNLALLQTRSVLPPSQAPWNGEWAAAELAVLPSGKSILVSNRSPGEGVHGPMDRLVQFSLGSDGRVTGKPREINTGGRGLRHFEVSPDGKWVAVACQKTNEIVMFAVGKGDSLKEVARVKGVDQPTLVRWML